MTAAWAVVLRTLLAHWRRKPLQLAALLLGLAVATALWSGVQALNAEARAAYARAAAVLGGDQLDRLVPRAGTTLAVEDYVALRRAGWRVAPVLEGTTQLGDVRVRLLGIDPLTVPPQALGGGAIDGAEALRDFLNPPHSVIAAPATLARLRDASELGAGQPAEDLPPGVVIADIGLAERLLDQPGRLTHLIVAPTQKPGIPPIDRITGDRLDRLQPAEDTGLAQLTDSFHLNLTAFGLLSFVVGLFIVHATIGLAFEQRRGAVRTLRARGASERQVTLAILVELTLFAVGAGAIGMLLGYGLAAALLPDVAASLRGLYGAQVPGQLSLRPEWWLAGIGMALGGTAVAAVSALWRQHRMPVLATAQTEAWRTAHLRGLRLQAGLAAGLALGGGLLLWQGAGLAAGFATMGAVLMAAALALPGLLALAIAGLTWRARTPVVEWFLAEARAQLGGISLALMALLLALAVNIGVGSMVSSFRVTFLGWLDQRLSADLYIRGQDTEQATAMAAALDGMASVDRLLPIQSVALQTTGAGPFDLYGIVDDAMYRGNWPLIAPLPRAWDRVADGSGIMISEQFARRLELRPGDTFAPGSADWAPQVVALYPDYGNPVGQAIVANAELTARWPETPRLRYAVLTTDPGAAGTVLGALRDSFDLRPDQAIDQASLKAFSRDIFERTFAVTLALNVLTFAVAGLALLTGLLTLAEMRLPQVAPIWALGLTRGRLARLEVLRAVFLAVLTAVIAVPLGILVAWILLAVVNVEAFGWRIPLRHYPGQWAALLALAVATAAAAALIPARRLRRVPPAVLLRVFADER
ncbi:MAG: ABC transporter permease [Pseudomonadota bacterium]